MTTEHNTAKLPPKIMPQPPDHSPRLRRVFGGSMLLAGTITGIGLELHSDDSVFDHRIDYSIGADATPSDAAARAFDTVRDIGVPLGWGAIGIAGANMLYAGFNKKEAARQKFAYNTQGSSPTKKFIQFASASQILGITLLGCSVDIANGVGGAQKEALDALLEDVPANTKLVTNTQYPELATTPTIIPEAYQSIVETKEANPKKYENVDVVPITWTWPSVIREKDAGSEGGEEDRSKKILAVVMALPPEQTGLPESDEDCTTIAVNASKSLGNPGDKIYASGHTLVIKDPLDSSGASTNPIAMNTDDFSRCFSGLNPKLGIVLPSMIALRGTENDLNKFIHDSKLGQLDSPTSPTKISTVGDFIRESDTTSKNNSNGLIIFYAGSVSMMVGALLAAKAKSELVKARGVNSRIVAAGGSNRDLSRIAYLRGLREAITSTAYSVPVVAALDYSIAAQTPGATGIAPSAGTYLTALGVAAGISLAATRVVVPGEIHKLNPVARGSQ